MIIVAILCFNEEGTIGPMVLQSKTFCDKVVVVNDGSRDQSAEVAKLAGAEVVAHDHNRGYGAAIATALRVGCEENCDVLITMDGDGQHDPCEIPLLAWPIIEGRADVVIGSRFLFPNQEKPPFYRSLGQFILTQTTNAMSGCHISDSQCGYRAISAKALRLINLKEQGFGSSSELQFEIAKHHLRVAEVPVSILYPRPRKRNPFAHGAYALSRIFWMGVTR